MVGKELIKKNIREAIGESPHRKDIGRVSIFGSYVNGKPRKGSDIDVLIEFTPKAVVGFFKLAQIQRGIADYIRKPVDLLTPEQISDLFRAEVIKQAEIIYEKR